MSSERGHGMWLPRLGWLLVALLLAGFLWGLRHRASLQMSGQKAVQMLFVPSVEQGTLVRRGDELARFIRADCGLTLRSQVPDQLRRRDPGARRRPGRRRLDPGLRLRPRQRPLRRRGAAAGGALGRALRRSWSPAPGRASRTGSRRSSEPQGRGAARDAGAAARRSWSRRLDALAPGWVEVAVETDRDAVRHLVERRDGVDGAASRYVYSGPNDLVGDGRKELEDDRPGTLLRDPRSSTPPTEPAAELSTVYYGCILARTDSGVRPARGPERQAFAFSDETSTSGHIFARALLERARRRRSGTCSSPAATPTSCRRWPTARWRAAPPSTRRRRRPTSATAPWSATRGS